MPYKMLYRFWRQIYCNFVLEDNNIVPDKLYDHLNLFWYDIQSIAYESMFAC